MGPYNMCTIRSAQSREGGLGAGGKSLACPYSRKLKVYVPFKFSLFLLRDQHDALHMEDTQCLIKALHYLSINGSLSRPGIVSSEEGRELLLCVLLHEASHPPGSGFQAYVSFRQHCVCSLGI